MIDRLISLINSAANTHVLFVGETIIDEYRFVSPMSKPPKENILAVRFRSAEVFEGGVVAAAKHAESFCRVSGAFTLDADIIKTRYIEENYVHKLFEVQHIDESPCIGLIPEEAFNCEVVAVTDFGHGMMTPAVINQLCSSNKYLAVATQTNAHNFGFNLITKYPRADYICIDEPEARLAAGDRDAPIEDVMRKLAKGRCNKFVVTHGKHGAYGLHNGRFVHSPTHTTHVTDTMGAGDAFFSVTAPMAKDASIEDLLTIGNAAGSLKTQILGHRESITKAKLIEYLNGTC